MSTLTKHLSPPAPIHRPSLPRTPPRASYPISPRSSSSHSCPQFQNHFDSSSSQHSSPPRQICQKCLSSIDTQMSKNEQAQSEFIKDHLEQDSDRLPVGRKVLKDGNFPSFSSMTGEAFVPKSSKFAEIERLGVPLLSSSSALASPNPNCSDQQPSPSKKGIPNSGDCDYCHILVSRLEQAESGFIVLKASTANGQSMTKQDGFEPARHWILLPSKHVESVHSFGPPDIPLLDRMLLYAQKMLDRIESGFEPFPLSVVSSCSTSASRPSQPNIRSEPTPVSHCRKLKRLIGFVSGPIRDPLSRITSHLHLHIILGPLDSPSASWVRRTVVFNSVLNFYELEDLIAEIREETSNNRAKSGYSAVKEGGRKEPPIEKVVTAGSAQPMRSQSAYLNSPPTPTLPSGEMLRSPFTSSSKTPQSPTAHTSNSPQTATSRQISTTKTSQLTQASDTLCPGILTGVRSREDRLGKLNRMIEKLEADRENREREFSESCRGQEGVGILNLEFGRSE